MRMQLVRAVAAFGCLSMAVWAQCANDHREEKKDGILVTDFTITGTQTISETELAEMTSEFVGNCYNDDSEELGERVRMSFQDRGYFAVEVKSVRLKASDPLGHPKPVTMEAEVTEGPKYKVGVVTFVDNRAFPPERLRSEFPMKSGDIFERDKVVSGLDSLRKLYGKNGYLDFFAIPEALPSSNGTIDLKLSVQEGPQYRLEKIEFVGKKEMTARLEVKWNMAEGSVYDWSYLDRYIEENRDFLPKGFERKDVEVATDCPKALVDVRFVVDASEAASPLKSVPCEESKEKAK